LPRIGRAKNVGGGKNSCQDKLQNLISISKKLRRINT